jgi:hypothetical protein
MLFIKQTDMENNEKMLSPEESLSMISEMIALAKKSIVDKGFHYLLWGWLVLLASLTDYVLLKLEINYHYYVWFIMPIIGMPIAFWYNSKHYANSKSHLGSIITYLWLGFAITGAIIFTMGLIKNPENILQNILLILGLALFVSGSIIRFRPVYLGGVVYWLAALACIFASYQEQLLINAGAALLGGIIPGYLLKRKFTGHV